MDTQYLSSAYKAFFRNVVERLPETPTIAAMRFLFRALPVEKITDYEVGDEKLRTVLRSAYGGLELDNPVILAAGYGEPYVLEKTLKMGFSAVTAKVSKEPRDGNPNPRIVRTPKGPANSMGYRNHGMVQLRKDLERIRKRMPKGKKIIQNVSDSSIENYLAVIERLDPLVDMFEINDCLNSPGIERLGFLNDPGKAKDLFMEVRKVTRKPLCLKLPRADDFPQIYSETIPIALNNGFTILNYGNTKIVYIERLGRFYGLSGSALQEDTLDNVRKIKNEFGQYADIIGTGGIDSGIFAYIIMHEGGAKAVSVITGFAGNPFIAKEINEHLKQIRK